MKHLYCLILLSVLSLKLNKGDYLIAKLDNIRINGEITVPEVRLIAQDGTQLGVLTVEEALQKAADADLDLIEVAPQSKPPVCKLMDYGKLKYEEKKKAHQSKKKQHVVKLKEIRLRPRIGPHDLDTKLNMGKKFLKDGCKLKVTIMFRGREMARLDLGELMLNKVIEMLEDVAVLEKRNPLEGRRMSLIFNGK